MKLFVLLSFALGVTALAAQEARVEDVLSSIRKSHPEILAAESESMAARKKADGSSWVYPDPEIMFMRGTGSGRDLMFFPNQDVQNSQIREAEVRVSQGIPFPGKLTLEARATRARSSLVDARLHLEGNRISSEYLALLARSIKLKKEILLLTEYEKTLGGLEYLVFKNYREGRGLAAEGKLVTAEKLSTAEAIQGMKAERAELLENLKYYSPVMASDASFESFMEGLLARVNAQTLETDSIEKLPEISYASSMIEIKESERKRSYLNHAPDLAFFGGYKTRNTEGSFTALSRGRERMGLVGLTVRVPVWSFFGNRKISDALDDENRSAVFSKDALVSKLRNRIQGLKGRIAITGERLHTHTHQISPISTQGSEAAVNAYRSGRGSTETVMVALDRNFKHRIDELAVRLELHSLLIEAGSALNQLNLAGENK